jgi:AcrR family transcriptional regulator
VNLLETERRTASDKRQRILDAARFLVLRQGLRATTMEAIAREARIAKPTLYSYFPDKDAVFAGIIEDLIADIRLVFGAALHGEGDVVARVGAALTVKHKAVQRLLQDSPHADELYSEHDRAAAPQFRAIEAEIEAAIIAELTAAGVSRARPLTQVLLAGTYGVGRKARSIAEIGPAIRLLTERLLRPEIGA